jgi:hypothetical protein
MVYITHFHTINAHLLVLISYLISQYTGMDHWKFLSVFSVGFSIIMKDDCTFNQFWILLWKHHIGGTADVTCIAIHSQLKPAVQYHTQEHCMPKWSSVLWVTGFVKPCILWWLWMKLHRKLSLEYSRSHTLAQISLIVIILFNMLFPWWQNTSRLMQLVLW